MGRNRVKAGYCLDRTRREIRYLPLGLIFLFLGVCAGAFGIFGDGIHEDWGRVPAILLCVFLLFLGGLTCYNAIRDCFFPGRSRLANSIRSQLPYPDEAPAVEELFAMVDSDLHENGIWYESVCIGNQWVLGEEATMISRIRGIFVLDKLHHHSTSNGSRVSREMALVLVDDRWRKARTSFRSPRELQAAADYLALRVPEARRGKDADKFTGMSDEEKDAFLREFNARQARRKPAGSNQF